MFKDFFNFKKKNTAPSEQQQGEVAAQLTSSELFGQGKMFPPTSHRARIDRYKKNKKLFLGKHFDVFKNFNGSERDRDLLYVSTNLAGIICKKSADFLFGEDVSVSSGKEDSSKEQVALDRLVANNCMGILNYEGALSNAYRGDVFIKTRYGQEYGGELPVEIDKPKVIIEPLNAETVFPEVSPYDRNKIVAYHIAVPCKVIVDDRPQWQLFIESHYAGRIEYRVYNLEVLNMYLDGSETVIDSWKITDEVVSAREVINTGVPAPLVTHIPNYSTDDTWEGIDDVTEHIPVLEEINNRLTQVADILDKHADPMLALGSGILGEDMEGNPTFHVQRDKVVEVMGKDDVIPQYVTWEGQLAHAFTELDKLVELLLTTAEIPAVALGKGDSGTSGSSGLAIKWRMNSLLAKINRKRQYFDKGLKEILVKAQLLESAVGIADYELTIPKLTFADGLPKDATEEATVMNIRTGGMKTLSQKTAIMRMENLTEEQAELELSRITEEQEAQQKLSQFADPSIFNEPMDKKDIDKKDTTKHAEGNPITDKATVEKPKKPRTRKTKTAE